MQSNLLHPFGLWKAAGRNLAVAQGPRPGAVAANSLLGFVVICRFCPDSRAPGQSAAQSEVYLIGTACTRQCFGRPARIVTAGCIMVCRLPWGPVRWPACPVTRDRNS